MKRKALRELKKKGRAPSERRPTGSLLKPVFDVTFGCNYKVVTCVKIAADSEDEAVKIGEAALRAMVIECPPEGDMPEGYVRSMGTAILEGSSLLGIRPQENEKTFDMRVADFKGYL